MKHKIVCFTDSLGLGGAQRQLVGLAVLLKTNGCEVSTLLYYDIPFYKDILDRNNIDSVVVGGSSILSRCLSIYRYLKLYKPRVVIAYQATPSIIACMLRPFLRIPVLIVSERGTSELISLKTRVRFKLWRFADFIVPNSYSQTQFIFKHTPEYSNKVVTITNFVNTNLFIPSLDNTKDWHPLKIVILGRITPEKNILEFIKAINLVKNVGYDIEVRWYGDTNNADYNNECKELVCKYNIGSVFKFYPAQTEVVQLYQNADVFCLPSLNEGFPNVICEAMSCGLPILCSNICDNPLIVEDGENGILFSPDRAENIADAIIKYINLPEGKKVQMGVRSRELALEKFSSEVFIQKYINLIES